MATIEEETAKRYALAKRLNPWMAIDYLEQQLAERDQRIQQLQAEIYEANTRRLLAGDGDDTSGER